MPKAAVAPDLSRFAQMAVEHAKDSIVVTDTSGRFQWVNPAFEHLTGYDMGEVLGKKPGDVLQGAETDPATVHLLRDALAARRPVRCEIYNYAKDGRGYWIELSIAPVFDDQGRHIHFMAVERDVTERRRLEAAAAEMRAAEERHKAERRILSETSEWLYSAKSVDELRRVIKRALGVLMPGTSGHLYLYANSRDTLDLSLSWGGSKGYEHFAPDDCWALRRGRAYAYGQNALDFACGHTEDAAAAYFCLPILAHGETIGLLHVTEAGSAGGQAAGIAPFWDTAVAISEQISLAIANVRLREELKEQSVRDHLTGLWNRRWFLETANLALSRAKRTGAPFGLLSIDVDHFKTFNDQFGHEAGDMVLREVGSLMYQVFRGDMSPCRIGGEEFVVVCAGTERDAIVFAAQQFQEQLRALDIIADGGALPQITVSQGVAMAEAGTTTALDVLKLADKALYAVKAAGRDGIRAYADLDAAEARLAPPLRAAG